MKRVGRNGDGGGWGEMVIVLTGMKRQHGSC